MFRWRHPVSAISGLMSAVADGGRGASEGAGAGPPPPPPSGVCVHPGCCLRVLSQCLVLQVRDSFVSAHVLISHELLDAVGVHVHVYLAAQGANF